MKTLKKERKKRKQTAETKIGVGKGDWKDLSNFKKLGAIYTKEVLWTFYHSAHQQCIKQLFFSQPNSLFSLNVQKLKCSSLL